jgi:hypothetical protein
MLKTFVWSRDSRLRLFQPAAITLQPVTERAALRDGPFCFQRVIAGGMIGQGRESSALRWLSTLDSLGDLTYRACLAATLTAGA